MPDTLLSLVNHLFSFVPAQVCSASFTLLPRKDRSRMAFPNRPGACDLNGKTTHSVVLPFNHLFLYLLIHSANQRFLSTYSVPGIFPQMKLAFSYIISGVSIRFSSLPFKNIFVALKWSDGRKQSFKK